MSDAGFNQSEKMLNDLEKRIHEQYEQASKEMAEKVDAYFAKFKSQDEAKREQYENGEISKKEYKRQLKYLRDTTQETICDTTTLEVPMRVIETECYIIYEHLFSRGCSITTLSRRVCKEGYIFKNKGEK